MPSIQKAYERLCRGLCERIPQKKREEMFFSQLEYARVREDFNVWLGKRILLTILAGVIGFLVFQVFGLMLLPFIDFSFQALQIIVPLLGGVLFAAIVAMLFYLHHYYVIEGRAGIVEDILPDFLMLVSSNVNAGMTPFSAFRASARKEFGPLSEEIKIASAKSLGTRSFASALKQLSLRIKSRALDETIAFFAQALKSGGKLTRLLETTATDLRQTQEMRKELRSSTRMYMLFVAFVIVVATPLLLAVSIQFLGMISSIQGESVATAGQEVESVAFLATELNIDPAFMMNVSYLLLLSNAVLASLFMGVIGQGRAKMGLRYAPLILLASVIALIASNIMLGQFLGI